MPPYAELRKVPLWQACHAGAWKNLREGVTTVCHHNALHPVLFSRSFRKAAPVRVVRRYSYAHSLHFTDHADIAQRYRSTPKVHPVFPDFPITTPFIIHLAEGTSQRAAVELDILDRLGALGANTRIVHGVGLTDAQRSRMITQRAGLIWCPSSNLYLLGETAQVGDFSQNDLLAIGTDSLLTADGGMFAELRAAHATGQLTPMAIFRAVTTDAAELLGLNQYSGTPYRYGALLPGSVPDFFAADVPLSTDPYTTLLNLTRDNLVCLWVAGKPIPLMD
jgi:hypothetical protein